MPGVEAERSATDDTRVGLLAYFQDTSRSAWQTHHEQHDLEDKALALAVGGVKDALALAVSRVEQAQLAQRELLEGDIAALKAALLVEHADLERRSIERNQAARDQAQLRADAAERWIRDVMDQHWSSHASEHELARTALNDKLSAWQLAHQREHSLIQLAVDKANDALDRRLEGMNEFRAQLDRMGATLVTRDVLDVRLASVAQRLDKTDDSVEKRIGTLEQTITRSEGKSNGYSAFWGYIVGATGLAIAVALFVRDVLLK